MFVNMRRLHPRGATNRGICVDAEGAMLGPDCVLVRHTPRGFEPLHRDTASTLQKCHFDVDGDRDWLFQQCQRIADALNDNEVALAQIHGLHIPLAALNDTQLSQAALAKASYNPDEPRIPKGDPHGGEWTTGSNEAELGPDLTTPSSSSSSAETDSSNEQSASSDDPSISITWEITPRDVAPATHPAGDAADRASDTPASGAASQGPLGPPGIDAINPDYSIENLLFLLGTGGIGGASRTLARALLKLGITRGVKTHTHHIIAKRARPADPARKTLRRFGINLHDSSNGVFLPEQQHQHLHSNEYYDAVNKALAGATTKSEVEEVLKSIARKLLEGTFP